MEKQVLTPEEVTQLKELRHTYQELMANIGNAEMQIMTFQLKKEQFKLQLQQLQEKVINLAKELESKYGSGTISLETNEFLPNT